MTGLLLECPHRRVSRWCQSCADSSPEMVPMAPERVARLREAWAEPRPMVVQPPPAHRCPRPSRLSRAGTAVGYGLVGFALAWFLPAVLEAL